MDSLKKAQETQVQNIQKKTGKTLEELAEIAARSGLTKHSEVRALFQHEFGLGYGDANTLVHAIQQSDGERAAQAKGQTADTLLDEIYAGPRAALRPIHERLMESIRTLGDFDALPKKGYISLRRKRQFAMLGPATNTRFELGLNHKNLGSHPRLVEQPAGSMCNYKVKLTQPGEVDDELIGWVRQAYENAG
jgi:hypothetical protein